MEKRFEGGCNCLNDVVSISAEEYRRLMDASVRCEIAKSMLCKCNTNYMDTGTLRLILDAPLREED